MVQMGPVMPTVLGWFVAAPRWDPGLNVTLCYVLSDLDDERVDATRECHGCVVLFGFLS
jgi:hypothetical protein